MPYKTEAELLFVIGYKISITITNYIVFQLYNYNYN